MADFKQVMEQLQDFDINDVDWDRIGVWPFFVRVALFIVAVIVIFTGCHFLVVSEKHGQLEVVQGKEKQLKKSFQSKAFEAANLHRYKKQMEEMQESFGALVARLPSDTEVPGLLEDIDDKGVESRLSINKITLQKENKKEFYVELPIKITVSGGYHEFGAFVSGVAGMPRIVTLHDFSISKVKEGKASTGLLKMDVVAKTYRYNSDGADSGKKGKGKKKKGKKKKRKGK